MIIRRCEREIYDIRDERGAIPGAAAKQDGCGMPARHAVVPTFVDLVGQYTGTIVCDALATHAAGARAGPGITLAACWAHCPEPSAIWACPRNGKPPEAPARILRWVAQDNCRGHRDARNESTLGKDASVRLGD